MYKEKRCILVADDEVKMVRALKDFLKANNFHIIEAHDGEMAIDLYFENSSIVDLVLLDVMMPKCDGFEVLENYRQNSSLVPVIMFTAKGEEYDQLKGFQCGADDYIKKPFSPTLLLARIESVLKRVGKSSEIEISKGTLSLNSVKRYVKNNDEILDLTKREFDLLYFFISNSSMAFTREQILNSVWGYEFDGDIRTVDTHVKQLRIKLKDNGTYIKTVHRVGYKFEV